MKHSANGNTPSNIYTQNADRVLADFCTFIEGNANALVCVVSSRQLADDARAALEASCERLNFGRGRIAWICLEVDGSATGSAPSELSELSASDLRQIIEGLDPVAIIVTDSNSASAIGIAYETPIDSDTANRVLCRDIIAFKNFEEMLSDPDKKQRAWYLLKHLK